MSMCLVFVFASLLEFAVVNVISRKEVRTIKPAELEEDQNSRLACCKRLCRDIHIPEPPKVKEAPAPKKVDPRSMARAERVDRWSKTAFPTAFISFMIIWWIYYTR